MAAARGGSGTVIPVEGGRLPAYLALPVLGHGCGVLVLHEIFGLGEHIRDVCDRLAREGFVALAPDLYHGRRGEARDEALRLASTLEAGRVASELAGAAGALMNQDAVDGARIGAVGFCMGGHLALLAAAQNRRVGAVVDFYGVDPGLPLDAASLDAALLAIFAEEDDWVSAETIEALRADLAAAGKPATFHVQSGVGHGFMNETRPDRYAAAAASEGWDRMVAFLRAELS